MNNIGNIKEYLEDLWKQLPGVTGPGYNPIYGPKNMVYLCCVLGNGVSLENLRIKIMDTIEFEKNQGYPTKKSLDELNNSLWFQYKELEAVLGCPYEDLPLFVNSSIAAKTIALHRLKDGR